MKLETCISEIRDWMQRNHLKLNDTKTEFLVIGSKTQLSQLSNDSIQIGDSIIKSSHSARNIGAIFDCTMSMKEHVATMCRACYCIIRNIGKVRSSLTEDAAMTIVHAFISSKLDHMNSLLFGITKHLLQKLQKIQNNSARIIVKAKRRDHISPVLKRLHWLPVDKRIEFKILLTTFKAMTGLAPGYIHDLLEPYQPRRALRSMDLTYLRKPRSRTKTFGDRAFASSAPYLWNKLPRTLRQCVELESFKTSLKCHLFKKAYE